MTVTASARRTRGRCRARPAAPGTSARDALDQRPDALAFGRGEPRERLVEQQHARPGGEREPHVDQPLAAVGQRTCLGALDAREPEVRRSRPPSPPRSRRWRARCVQRSKRRGWRACTARRMFSAIGRAGNRLVIWNERPTPARQMRSGGRPEMSSARPAAIVPVSGGNMPETRLKAVVLPAPFGPISACKRAVAHRERHAFDRLDAAEILDDALGTSSTGPSHGARGFRNAGSGASPTSRPAIAAASTVVLRQRREHAARRRPPARSARTR